MHPHCPTFLLAFLPLCSGLSADILRVPEDHATIQSAIASSEADDTILVQPGLYRESLGIEHSLRLVCASATEEVEVRNAADVLTTDRSSRVSVEGFRIVAEGDGNAVQCQGVTLTLVRCTLISGVFSTPLVGRGQTLTLQNCSVESRALGWPGMSVNFFPTRIVDSTIRCAPGSGSAVVNSGRLSISRSSLKGGPPSGETLEPFADRGFEIHHFTTAELSADLPSIESVLLGGPFLSSADRNGDLITNVADLVDAVNFQGPDQDEYDSAPELAKQFRRHRGFRTIYPPGDVDWSTFTLDAEQRITIFCDSESAPLRLSLFRIAGDTELLLDARAGVTPAVSNVLPAGTYHIKVESAQPIEAQISYSMDGTASSF